MTTDVNYDEFIEKYFKNYDNVTWHDVHRKMKIVNVEYMDKIKNLRDERDELLSDLRQLKHALKDGDYEYNRR